jgi:hypothetical protein
MVPEAQLGEGVGIVGKGIGIWDGAMWDMRSGPAGDADTRRAGAQAGGSGMAGSSAAAAAGARR